MDDYNSIVSTLGLTLGASWASGINLYAAVLVLGWLGMTGAVNLPPDLQILASPVVIGAAGLMYAVEFFADKIPGADTGWDAIHTFIRIPAGALLAYGATNDINGAVGLAAALVGGGVAAGSHATKAGSRVAINASPEPFSNWAASIGEDLAVIGGLWVALNHPILFLGLLILFIAFTIWLLPRIWRGIKRVFSALARFLGGQSRSPAPAPAGTIPPAMDPGQTPLASKDDDPTRSPPPS